MIFVFCLCYNNGVAVLWLLLCNIYNSHTLIISMDGILRSNQGGW